MGVAAKHAAVFELVKHSVAHTAEGDFPAVVISARLLFDTALTAHFNRLTSKGITLARWLGTYRNVAAMLLDNGGVVAVKESSGEYHTVAPQPARWCSGSMLGAVIFFFALNQSTNKTLADNIVVEVKKIVADNFLSDNIWNTKRAQEQLLESFPVDQNGKIGLQLQLAVGNFTPKAFTDASL